VNKFFSVTAAMLKGHQITFKDKPCRFHLKGALIATGHRIKQLWYIDCPSSEMCASFKHDATQLWHQRLGHVNEKRLKFAVDKQLIRGVNGGGKSDAKPRIGQLPFCEACVQGKQTRKPFHGVSDVQKHCS